MTDVSINNNKIARFEEKYTPEPNSGCWLWTAACHPEDGYGSFGMGSRTDGSKRQKPAHRVSWELFVGEIPTGLSVLHKCDVRCCVNPDHLFLGSQADNMKDCLSKGRVARGQKVHGAVLSPEDVLEIRCHAGTLDDIGNKFGISPTTVADIKKRRTWKWL